MKPRPPSSQCITPASETLESKRVSLCFQSRGNSRNTFSSERNGKTFTSVERNFTTLKIFVQKPHNALKTIYTSIHKHNYSDKKNTHYKSIIKITKEQKKVSTLVNEPPPTFKPMRHASLRDVGTKMSFTLLPKSRKQS